MAQVTSRAETWVLHSHRNHHGGGTMWLFAASGTTDGDVTDDPGVTSAMPSFDAGASRAR